MNEFRTRVVSVFGSDVPVYYQDIVFPYLRFELAKGNSLVERLSVAEDRCHTLIRNIFGAKETLWLELTFWENDHFLHPQVQLEILEGFGLTPTNPIEWGLEITVPSDDYETARHRYWAPIQTNSAGFSALIKAIVWAEHGTWEGLVPHAMFFDPDGGLILRPYDDRGAFLYATDKQLLFPFLDEFRDWIIEKQF